MKKITILMMALVLLNSGCSFDVEVMTAEPPSPTPTVTQAVNTPVATISATVEAPSPTPTLPSGPVFYDATITTDPGITMKGTIFPAGTKRIYAVWSYQNMRAGLNVRREWSLNGQLWLAREEVWDMTKYGESGVVRDVSIYDLDIGLPNGAYGLRIFIDGVIQPIGVSAAGQPETQVTFEIR